MARSLGAAWPGGEAMTPKRSAFFSPGPLALRVPLPSRLSADHARWMEIPLRFWRLQGQVCPTVSENLGQRQPENRPCDPEFPKSLLDKLSNESIDRKNEVGDRPASGKTGRGVTGGQVSGLYGRREASVRECAPGPDSGTEGLCYVHVHQKHAVQRSVCAVPHNEP